MYRIKNTSNYQLQGFTIVELLIVIVVIAILATITIVSYNGITQQSTATVAKQDLHNIATAVEIFKVDHGALPVITVPALTEPAPDFEEILRNSNLFEITRGADNSAAKSFVFCQPKTLDRLIAIAVNPVLKGVAADQLSQWVGRDIYYYDTNTGTVSTTTLQYNGIDNVGSSLCRSIDSSFVSGGSDWRVRWSYNIPIPV
ncbi:MAG: type IV pilin protein [Candidatus Microsaccharimonas sp.]